jgi:two-component system osmolarity sensor histidine kinase EnvZ
MRLTPNSLLARTAIVIVLALIASQLVSVALFRYYTRDPRIQLTAIGFVSQLKTIRAALETLAPEQHREFLVRLREERGIGVMRARDEESLTVAPDVPALRVARERLREEFGPEAEIYSRLRPLKPDAPAVLVTKLPLPKGTFYVVFPRGRIIEQDYSWAWLGWGIFGGILALAGAIFLMWRVNRPLKALAGAASAIGQGKTPPPVTEVGPDEVRAVAVAFNQMREDLSRLDQERATFLAGVSHDLRTPLSRLRLGIEMLPADPATRRDLEKDIEDINGIIDQFMDFARDESREPIGKMDLNLLVRSAAERAQHSGTRISLTLDTLPPVMLRPLAMQRVINNLIDNALKHAGNDIEIQTLGQTDTIVLSVLDRGGGIPPREVDRLKQPFTRLDSSRSGHSGAGLGLAIVDRIVKLHGGTFDLIPRQGGGTEARVSIPATP